MPSQREAPQQLAIGIDPKGIKEAELEELIASLQEVYEALGRFFARIDQYRRRRKRTDAPKLYTLAEVSERTGISLPTLQRYASRYQSRIPSAGTARTQRYPESALNIFAELKREGAGRRGRPAGGTPAPKRSPVKAAAGPKRPPKPFPIPPGKKKPPGQSPKAPPRVRQETKSTAKKSESKVKPVSGKTRRG